MKIIFWGTPSYSIATLEKLIIEGHQILAVVTQPDKKRGRGGRFCHFNDGCVYYIDSQNNIFEQNKAKIKYIKYYLLNRLLN